MQVRKSTSNRLKRKVGSIVQRRRVIMANDDAMNKVEDNENDDIAEQHNDGTNHSVNQPSAAPGMAVQSLEILNLFECESNPMEDQSPSITGMDPKVVAHKKLFYELIEQHYKTTTNQAMMNRQETDDPSKLIRRETQSKTSNTYKMKWDFAVITFGQHYGLVKKKESHDPAVNQDEKICTRKIEW